MAEMISDVHYRFSKIDRSAVRANLQVVLGTPDVSPLMVREVFRNFGRYLVDFLTATKRLNQDFLKTNVRVSGIEHLHSVLAGNKGGIAVSAHVGNWEMAGAILSLLGYPPLVVALTHQDPRVNAFFNRQRKVFGMTIIPPNIAIRRCLGHLRSNRMVAILAERDFGNHGIVMNFLGRPTMIPRGAAMFAFKTGAPLIPVFLVREEDHIFHISIGKPIVPPPPGQGPIADEQVKALMAQYLGLIEEQIRRYPTQWLMFRQFWIS